ncbi:MAG: NAD(P)H-dependent oxidoreductase [Actinobacteria bacterium]|nr:NAD(P)H-dependent oxidoreductase [Actinomycetota bacterium]
MSAVALVGNPRPGSRTLATGVAAAERICAELGGNLTRTIDLGELGGAVLDPDDLAARDAADAVAAADLLVVASPTYKATYTGLLKAFFDRYRGPGLTGVVAVGVMVAAAPEHALAGEVHLRPLLVELGAVVPAKTLFVLDSALDRLEQVIDSWLETAAAPLAASLRIG